MNLNKLNMILLAGSAMALVSCGGGGSSSSSNTAKPANFRNVFTGPQVTTSITGNTVKLSNKNGDVIEQVDENTAKVNGTTVKVGTDFNVSGPLSDNGSSNYMVYTGKAGPTAIYDPSTKTPDARGDIFQSYSYSSEATITERKPWVAGLTEFTGVDYQYSASNTDGTWATKSGKDGKITYDGESGGWHARFDNDQVKLDGEFKGKSVLGDATYNGVAGEFRGYDAVYTLKEGRDKTYVHETDGAFAGSNGTQTYAGVWGKTETTEKKK